VNVTDWPGLAVVFVGFIEQESAPFGSLVIDAVNDTVLLLLGHIANVVDELPLSLPLAAPLHVMSQPAPGESLTETVIGSRLQSTMNSCTLPAL
jgi:hypothetical protein